MTNQIKLLSDTPTHYWILTHHSLSLSYICIFQNVIVLATVCGHRKTELTTFNYPIDGKSAWTAERERTNQPLHLNFNEITLQIQVIAQVIICSNKTT